MKTAWYNNDILPQEMIKAAKGITWGFKLENAPHFPVLQEAILACRDSETIIDIGCGAGEVGRVFNQFKYTGIDLNHIVENVAKKQNKDLTYLSFDAYESSFEFCKEYDIVLCNSFLSEIEFPTKILNKILTNAKKYVVIHRQKYTNEEQVFEAFTYGGLRSPQYSISTIEFNKIIKNNFTPLYNKQVDDTPNYSTIVLQKIQK